MYQKAIFTGLCAPNKEKIKAGEFAEICLLSDINAILSADFTETAKWERELNLIAADKVS